MNKYFILPYKMGSHSSRALANELGIKQIYPDRRYRGRPNHILINWGYNTQPEVPTRNCKEILNPFSSTPYVSDKLKFFSFDSTARKVQHTTNKLEALSYLTTPSRAGRSIFCRTILNGHGGNGIVLAKTPDEIVNAPLYTMGITHHVKEYRIHIFKGEVFHIQQKRKMTSEKLEELGIEHTSLIRNYANGYVFAINDIEPPSGDTLQQAKLGITDYALDFGAVDIIENEAGFGHILEINSAPGLEGTTLNKYKEVFTNYLRSL